MRWRNPAILVRGRVGVSRARAGLRRRWVLLAVVVAGLLPALAVPVPEPLFETPESAVLLSADGSLLGAGIASDGQWRFPADGGVPERFAIAITTYEDRRFRYHPGIDPLAVARAMYVNAREGDVVSGGSTITMQVARMARGSRSRTYGQKLLEMLLALRIELRHSKDEVLGLYAANAPFGGNVVGLEAAAWRYFGRAPEHLSWAETATLAVLPNSPALVHPGRNRDRLRQKRDGLLRDLGRSGTLDDLELRLALLEPLPDEPVALPLVAPHLLGSLTRRAEHEGLGRRFRTTLDERAQRRVAGAVEEYAGTLESMGIRNAAVLVLDNETFDVVAYVGNSRWSVSDGEGYAMDLVNRPRSTGSVLKPLLFARMLDAGELLPVTLVPDVPTQFSGYSPENYDRAFRGAVPARDALARSLNVPAVWMLSRHGVDRFYDFLAGLGMTTLHRPPREYGLTLILGGAEGTLWDLTAMYANLAHVAGARRGRVPETVRRPRLLVSDEASTSMPVGLSVGAAWLTLQALEEVVRPGADAQWRLFEDAPEIAWKTGTSYGHRDGWAIGSSARYTVGVWTGNATGEGRPELTGIGTAAPLLFEVFNRLDRATRGSRPDFALREVTVCADDGYLAVQGCEEVVTHAPRHSHFETPSPHQRLVHLDAGGQYRVDARCERVSAMTHATWFVLPPGQEYFYRRTHGGYRPLPPVRPDCVGPDATGSMEFLYPGAGSEVYIPVDLAGREGRVVFTVMHRRADAELFWHVDGRYLGTTRTFHEQALHLEPGWHEVAVVDTWGERIGRRLLVLDRDAANDPARSEARGARREDPSR